MAIQINGNGTITGISSGGLPAGSVTSATLAAGAGNQITVYDRWRLTSNITGAQDPVSSNLTRSIGSGKGSIGSQMQVSSGIWTFPTEGMYKILAHWSLQNASGTNSWADMDIFFAQDGTNYNLVARAVDNIPTAGYYAQCETNVVVDVTNASVCKLKFKVNYENNNTLIRGSGVDYTWFDFTRIGDT